MREETCSMAHMTEPSAQARSARNAPLTLQAVEAGVCVSMVWSERGRQPEYEAVRSLTRETISTRGVYRFYKFAPGGPLGVS
jgi:hypothetical protein